MLIFVIVLILLSAAFGVGAVLEGLAWAALIGLVLLVAAAWLGFTKLRNIGRK